MWPLLIQCLSLAPLYPILLLKLRWIPCLEISMTEWFFFLDSSCKTMWIFTIFFWSSFRRTWQIDEQKLCVSRTTFHCIVQFCGSMHSSKVVRIQTNEFRRSYTANGQWFTSIRYSSIVQSRRRRRRHSSHINAGATTRCHLVLHNAWIFFKMMNFSTIIKLCTFKVFDISCSWGFESVGRDDLRTESSTNSSTWSPSLSPKLVSGSAVAA